MKRQSQTMSSFAVDSARQAPRRLRVGCGDLAGHERCDLLRALFCRHTSQSTQPPALLVSTAVLLRIRFHPNANYVVTGSMDKTVRVWDVQTGNCVRLLAGHSGNVTCVAVSPSGRQVRRRSVEKFEIRLE